LERLFGDFWCETNDVLWPCFGVTCFLNKRIGKKVKNLVVCRFWDQWP